MLDDILQCVQAFEREHNASPDVVYINPFHYDALRRYHPDVFLSGETFPGAFACNSPDVARVLIVEDDADISSLLVYTMESAHLDPVASADCKSAWKILTEYPPDLVLLDWMLPDMSGIELLQRIRRNTSLAGIPVIMLTARAEESDRVRGLASGADDYIVKPFSTRELCAHQQPTAYIQ